MDFPHPLTRADGLARLAEAAPRLGRAYAHGRNADHGPDRAPATSALSPYLRRRLITEAEAVAAALSAHGPANAEKFVSEVFWRTYFKGNLETRPQVWADYQARAAAGHERLAREPGLARAYEAAIEGRTGVDGFDDWARELTAHNWLHNHTRMWFASIWIFTLGLPWALGAEHFLSHLIDGDPASNTLSWRWVAGLHTRGKAYAATAENIRRYTDGRYAPKGLNEHPRALDEPDPGPARAPPPTGVAPAGEVALLMHLDDLHPESPPLGAARVVRVAGLVEHAPGAVEAVRAADDGAMTDALARAAAHFGCPVVEAAYGWAGDLPIVTAHAPIGPSAAALPASAIRLRRDWDSLTWPHATKGFFNVRAQIPRVLDVVGIGPV